MTRFSWIAATAALAFWIVFSYWVTPWAISAWWPTSYFETINRIWIDSARVGQPLRMVVDRQRQRNYRGDWDVYVRKQTGNKFFLFCHSSDQDWPFEKDTLLPDPLYLTTFMGIPPNPECPPFEEGVYYVAAEISIPWYLGSTIRIRVDSNTFKVIPEEFPVPLSGEVMDGNSVEIPDGVRH